MLEEFLSKTKNRKWLLWPPTIVWVCLMVYTFFRIIFHWQMITLLFPVYYIVAGYVIIVAGLILYFETKKDLNKIRDEQC